MAVAFLAEDGTVVPGATSFVEVAAADDFLSLDPTLNTGWTALDTTTKQLMLMVATQYMQERVLWKGELVDKKTPQPLAWPRRNVKTREGVQLSEMVVPAEVKRACALTASYLISHHEDLLYADQKTGLKRFRAETFELEWQDNFLGTAHPAFLRYLLMDLGQWVSDTGFKKIRRA